VDKKVIKKTFFSVFFASGQLVFNKISLTLTTKNYLLLRRKFKHLESWLSTIKESLVIAAESKKFVHLSKA
jgi:hypothetical protein